MTTHYLKHSLRFLSRNFFFSILNIAGLSIGFAAFFGLWQYADSELKTDEHHLNHERIARVCIDWRWSDDGKNWGQLAMGLIGTATINQIQHDFPEIENTTRILPQIRFDNALIDHQNLVVIARELPDGQSKVFKETKVVYADDNLFSFFSIPLLKGNAQTVLKSANSIVLSEECAIKYFGDENPIGKTLVLNQLKSLVVTGVFKTLPSNTHLNFDMVLSNASFLAKWSVEHWARVQGYLKFRGKEDMIDFQQKINQNKEEYWADILRRFPQVEADMFLQPLPEIAFSENYIGDTFRVKSKFYLQLISIVSVLIVAMAWINYVNLSLTRMSKRMKEVATRKMSGATAVDFIRQFIIEALIVNIVAVTFAAIILQISRVPARAVLDINPPQWSEVDFRTMCITVALIFGGVIISGIYPAIMSIKHNPRTLIAMGYTAPSSTRLSRVVSTVQYVIAITLIAWVSIAFLQLRFVSNKNPGFNKDQLVVIEAPISKPTDFSAKMENFKSELLRKGITSRATLSTNVMGDGDLESFHLKRGLNDTFVGVDANGGVDEDFIPLFKIQLLAGRNFKTDEKSNVILISKTAALRMGFSNPKNAIGAWIYGAETLDAWLQYEVIGVFDDYRTQPFFSFKESSTEYAKGGRGIALTYHKSESEIFGKERVTMEVDLDDSERSIQQASSLFAALFPGNVFTSYFLDEHVNRHYYGEKSSRNQLILFTLIAVFIAVLGLMGMIASKVLEKTKEIGIRKIHGAGFLNVAHILLSSTSRQIMYAVLISLPIAAVVSDKYLERFSVRIDIHWWYYIIPGMLMIMVMLFTTAGAVLRAAATNPIESLKEQ